MKRSSNLSLSVLAFAAVLFASPMLSAASSVNINTYDAWLTEVSPGGHITALASWADAGFEEVYPGEEAYFIVPTLSASADAGGRPALIMDFGDLAVGTHFIGGFNYEANDLLDLGGKSVSISPEKVRQGGSNRTYSLHLVDVNGKRRDYVGLTAEGSGSGPEYQSVTVNINTDPYTRQKDGFDIHHIKKIRGDYRDIVNTNDDYSGLNRGSYETRRRWDDVVITPEPSTLLLSMLMALLLLKRRGGIA